MERTCSNCNQNYDTLMLPEGANPKVCPYCRHSSGTFSGTPEKGKGMSIGKIVRYVVILAIFAVPTIRNFYEDLTDKSGPAKDPKEQALEDATLTGARLKIAQELFYDQNNEYTKDLDALFNSDIQLEISPGVTFVFQTIHQSGYTLTTEHPQLGSKKFTFKNMPPLHRAARSGNADQVAQLISQGQDLNRVDEFNYTPLEYAQKLKHTKVVELLIANGAKK
jgi:hypothetical protein